MSTSKRWHDFLFVWIINYTDFQIELHTNGELLMVIADKQGLSYSFDVESGPTKEIAFSHYRVSVLNYIRRDHKRLVCVFMCSSRIQ